MRHYFKAEKQNTPGQYDVVWFDSDKYTLEQAECKFSRVDDHSTKESEYTFGGIKYSKITYLGEHNVGWIQMTEDELLDAIFDESGIIKPKTM